MIESSVVDVSAGGAASTAGATATAQPSVHAAAGVSASSSTTSGWMRPSTWPRPNGTAVGNSRPIGQRTSSARPPALRATNQRSRSFCHWAMPPRQCSSAPMATPSAVPAALRPRSTFDETRCGR